MISEESLTISLTPFDIVRASPMGDVKNFCQIQIWLYIDMDFDIFE